MCVLGKKIKSYGSEALEKKMDRKEMFSLYKRGKKIVVDDDRFKGVM